MRPVIVVLLALISCAVAAPAEAARTWTAPTAIDAAVGSPDMRAAVAPSGVAFIWTVGQGDDRRVWAAQTPQLQPTELGPGRNVDVAAGSTGGVLFSWTSGPDDEGHVAWTTGSGSGSMETRSLGAMDEPRSLIAVGGWGDMAVAYAQGGKTKVLQRQSFGQQVFESVVGDGAPKALGTGLNASTYVVRDDNGALTAARVGFSNIEPPQAQPIPGSAGYSEVTPKVVVADNGNALLAFSGPPESAGDAGEPLRLAQLTGNTWSAVPVSGTATRTAIAASASEAVVAWTEQRGTEPGPLRLMTVDIYRGIAQAPVTMDQGVTGPPLLSTALSGHTLLTYETAAGLRSIRRDDQGPFQPPQAVLCAATTAASPVLVAGIAGVDAGYVALAADAAHPAIRIVADAPSTRGGDPCIGPVVDRPQTGSGGGATTRPPTTAPRPAVTPASVRVAKQKLATVLRKGLKLSIVAPQAGKRSLTLTIGRKHARKLRLGRKAVTVARRTVSLKAGANAVTVKVPRPLRRKLGKARAVTLQLRMTGADGQRLSRTVRLRR